MVARPGPPQVQICVTLCFLCHTLPDAEFGSGGRSRSVCSVKNAVAEIGHLTQGYLHSCRAMSFRGRLRPRESAQNDVRPPRPDSSRTNLLVCSPSSSLAEVTPGSWARFGIHLSPRWLDNTSRRPGSS